MSSIVELSESVEVNVQPESDVATATAIDEYYLHAIEDKTSIKSSNDLGAIEEHAIKRNVELRQLCVIEELRCERYRKDAFTAVNHMLEIKSTMFSIFLLNCNTGSFDYVTIVPGASILQVVQLIYGEHFAYGFSFFDINGHYLPSNIPCEKFLGDAIQLSSDTPEMFTIDGALRVNPIPEGEARDVKQKTKKIADIIQKLDEEKARLIEMDKLLDGVRSKRTYQSDKVSAKQIEQYRRWAIGEYRRNNINRKEAARIQESLVKFEDVDEDGYDFSSSSDVSED